MKRWEIVAAGLGGILLAAGAILVARSHGPMRDVVIADGCRAPVRVLEPEAASDGRAAILVHGLAANQRVMQMLGQAMAVDGWRVYLLDLPGHGGNSQLYSFARSEECAAFVVEALARTGQIDPQKTVLVGHSMGGDVIVRLADRFPAAATIAISPGPMVLPHRMPSNLLIFSAQYDLPAIKDEAAQLTRAAGKERDAQEDFRQRRAFELLPVGGATHTSLLADSRVYRRTTEWADKAVPPNPPREVVGSSRGGRIGALLGLLGMILLFPATTTAFCVTFGATLEEPPAEPPSGRYTLLRWAVASLLAVGVLYFWQPLRFMHLFGGDYLASFLLLTGLALLALEWNRARQGWRVTPRAVWLACVVGVLTTVAFGAWLNWQVTEAWLTGARWLRFAILLPVGLPYFYVEEAVLGRLTRHPAERFFLFLLLRLILWLAQIFAFFILSSANILLVLLTVYLGLFSILQRLGADAIRRRTGSLAAATLFDAILAAWFVAAAFPLG